MWYLWLLLGSAIGFFCTLLFILLTMATGSLRVDHSNPDKDLYRFEIEELDDLNKKKCVMLKIDHNANLTHE